MELFFAREMNAHVIPESRAVFDDETVSLVGFGQSISFRLVDVNAYLVFKSFYIMVCIYQFIGLLLSC